MRHRVRLPLLPSPKALTSPSPKPRATPRTLAAQTDLQRAAGNRAATHYPVKSTSHLSLQRKPERESIVQRTEIDAIKYINSQGLYQGPRGDNWLIKFLAKLSLDGYHFQYYTIYNLLIQNLPEQPLPGRDGYDPPTVSEVKAALGDEIAALNAQAEQDFRDSLSGGFSMNHVRDDETAAVDRCRDRLQKADNASANTVLLLTTREKRSVLESLAQARANNWDYINISCQSAIQGGGFGIFKLSGVKVSAGLDQNMNISHLFGDSLEYQDKKQI